MCFNKESASGIFVSVFSLLLCEWRLHRHLPNMTDNRIQSGCVDHVSLNCSILTLK